MKMELINIAEKAFERKGTVIIMMNKFTLARNIIISSVQCYWYFPIIAVFHISSGFSFTPS